MGEQAEIQKKSKPLRRGPLGIATGFRPWLALYLALAYLLGLFIVGLGTYWLRADLASALSVLLGGAVVGLSFFSLLYCGRPILNKTGLVKLALINVVKYVFIGALLLWAFYWPAFWAPGFVMGLFLLFPLLGAFYYLGR